MDLHKIFTYPYDNELILRKQKSLRRELLAREGVEYVEKRIAILGGATTDDIKNLLEIFLLASGIKPSFYQSEYNKWYEDAVFENPTLAEFRPEIIVIFTGHHNLSHLPEPGDSPEIVRGKLSAEFARYQEAWEKLFARYHAVIIQNNFDLPAALPLGSLEAREPYGLARFIAGLNEKFAAYAAPGFYLHDLNSLAAKIGLDRYHNPFQYYAYKFPMNYDVMPEVALSLAKIIRGILGKNKKCLVLDLDNTLWGGVIGDDGMEGIKIGRETPTAEAYTAFQEYVLALKKRGVILAVASKNDEAVARGGFSHPDSVLDLADFATFHANWEPKNLSLAAIAAELNIGTDSLVFIDDNPAERQLIRDTMPEVAVPEVNPTDVFSYIRAIEGAGYFEPVSISADDQKRADTYRANAARQKMASAMGSYDDFLKSLAMQAEIDAFRPIYFDRIAQLTNKSNQFNLTTRRYTRADIENMAADSRYLTLYGRLTDKFGDNGLVSVVIGEIKGDEVHIILWLMSCRVLKRGMEQAMLDALAAAAMERGCHKLVGYYYPTKKNPMVANLYGEFGFTKLSEAEGGATWELPLADYERRGRYIAVSGAK